MLKIFIFLKNSIKWGKICDIIGSMEIKQVLGKVRKACEQYNLIEDGDKIAVGISGGKDSITLLTCLSMLKHFYPKKFTLGAIAIDIFSGQTDYSKIKEYCKKLDIPLTIVPSNIKRVVFDIRKEPNPCSLCANLRRGFLNSTAIKLGYNKVALGHHADDLIQTLFMSMFHESRLNTFLPKTQLTNSPLVVIRPLALTFEKEIIGVSKNMPVIFNKCPANKHTERENINQMIQNLNKRIPGVEKKILSALTHPERNNLFDKLNNN